MVFVGLDCGGSSTRVLAINEKGGAIFRGQSGAANLLSTPRATIRQSLRTATHHCPTPTTICACFAGLVDDTIRKQAVGYLKEVFPDVKKIRAEPDYVAALAACGPASDFCLIAGTGSIVCSWQDGVAVKTGGRGPLLGDVGSVSQIGKRFLNVYLDDPSAASPRMKKSVSEVFETDVEREVITKLYGSSAPGAMLAKFGKVVARESLGGAEWAIDIIRSELTGLARLLVRHIKSGGETALKYRVGLAGGLWKCSPIYKEEFERALTGLLPEISFDLFVLRKPPVEGAAALAKGMAA
jgi:N-acetylglucosamine kinase-like BadF-type ATPase